jgi:hypothetical protein
MYHLSGQDILHVWEIGQAQHPIDRALTIVAVALPNTSRDVLANLRIGRRDALLFAVREQTFGAQLNSLVECPFCQERLEFSLNATAIGMMQEPVLDQPDPPQQARIDDYDMQFRLPTSLDLEAIANSNNPEAARHVLAQRCVLSVYSNGGPLPVDALPEAVVQALADRMADCDPQADVEIVLTCSACSHQWQTSFDIVSFFWTEICAQAKRLLREVDILARVYGWREADILSMSAARRQAYLEMVM